MYRIISDNFMKSRPRTLVIGDSHATHLCGTNLRKIAKRRNRTSYWLGPRLLFNISRDGFVINPEDTSYLRRQKFARLIIILGEIDIRVHLANHPSRISNLEEVCVAYCQAIKALGDTLGIEDVSVVCGPPPSDTGEIDPRFPRRGPLVERIKVFQRLNEILEDVVTRKFREINYVFPWSAIQDSDGSLSKRFTHDGCHVNTRGANVVRRSLNF